MHKKCQPCTGFRISVQYDRRIGVSYNRHIGITYNRRIGVTNNRRIGFTYNCRIVTFDKKWLDLLETARNGWKCPECLEMTAMAGNGWT